MNEYLLSFLLTITSLVGAGHPANNYNWKTIEDWHVNSSGTSVFVAEIKSKDLKCDEKKFLEMPMIIHGAHEIYVNNNLKVTFGDPSFKSASPFYLKPSISCADIKHATVKWVAYSYSQYFARFNSYPSISGRSAEKVRFLHEIINLISGASLLLLCFITSIIFYRKIPNNVFFANIFANLGFGAYFIFSSTPYFAIDVSMLLAHKMADMGVWLGICSFFYILYNIGLVSKISLKIIVLLSFLSSTLIFFSNDGDTIQFGTTLPFPFLIMVLVEATIKSISKLKTNLRESVVSTISVLFFFISGLYEIALVVGLFESNPTLAIGILGALIAIALLVQVGITNTYKQRDELLLELESKVEMRTYELKQALIEKDAVQAELIQSAKLASLGTLSAGIAHEINNNINYINACVVGLDREFKKGSSINPEKIDKLLSTVKHGTKMTIDIVNSLRNYTGLNQSKMKIANIKNIVNDVKTIIKSKLGNIKIDENYIGSTELNCNVAGISQLIMNLLTNAIDVVDKDCGLITISTKTIEGFLILSIKDNGSGMNEEVKNKIFDPFFTTKDVGGGTGLGLYIVNKEVVAHKGAISVTSSVGQGTEFLIKLPIFDEKLEAA